MNEWLVFDNQISHLNQNIERMDEWMNGIWWPNKSPNNSSKAVYANMNKATEWKANIKHRLNINKHDKRIAQKNKQKTKRSKETN